MKNLTLATIACNACSKPIESIYSMKTYCLSSQYCPFDIQYCQNHIPQTKIGATLPGCMTDSTASPTHYSQRLWLLEQQSYLSAVLRAIEPYGWNSLSKESAMMDHVLLLRNELHAFGNHLKI